MKHFGKLMLEVDQIQFHSSIINLKIYLKEWWHFNLLKDQQ